MPPYELLGKAWAHHADEVVGEFTVHLRNCLFRHMTTHATAGVVWASCSYIRFLFGFAAAGMASKAFLVVGHGIALQRLVWVVTRDAGDPLITCIPPAPTLFQAPFLMRFDSWVEWHGSGHRFRSRSGPSNNSKA